MDPRLLNLIQEGVKALMGINESLAIISKRVEKLDHNHSQAMDKLSDVLKKAVEPPTFND